jgi:hypothetical protein
VNVDTPSEAAKRLWPDTAAAGQTEPHTFHWRFLEWRGEPIKDTYGGKAVIDSEGVPLFAELALIRVLKHHGFDGAVWADSFRKCFRDAMPPLTCELRPHVREAYDRIAKLNGTRAGCWDVIAWNRHGISFVECKRKGRDRITANERQWLQSALDVGLRLDHFAICEWDFE